MTKPGLYEVANDTLFRTGGGGRVFKDLSARAMRWRVYGVGSSHPTKKTKMKNNKRAYWDRGLKGIGEDSLEKMKTNRSKFATVQKS